MKLREIMKENFKIKRKKEGYTMNDENKIINSKDEINLKIVFFTLREICGRKGAIYFIYWIYYLKRSKVFIPISSIGKSTKYLEKIHNFQQILS